MNSVSRIGSYLSDIEDTRFASISIVLYREAEDRL